MSTLFNTSFALKPRTPSAARLPHLTRLPAAAEVSQSASEAPQQPAFLVKSSGPAPFIHEIPATAWEKGIPAVMGAHLMASGTIAPLSTSKGAAVGVAKHMFLYPDGEYECNVLVHATKNVAAEALAEKVLSTAEAAIAARGAFTLVLSGGSLVNALEGLAGKSAEWDKWHVFWVDERVVPHNHPDSNFLGAKEAFLSGVPIPEENIHPIVEGLTAEEAAKQYEGMLLGLERNVLPKLENGFPVFDLILLGVGPDGHVASLFPNKIQTAAKEGWVLHIDNSPKPPPSRITLSMPVINNAAHVSIVALGEGKSEIVQRCLEHQTLPGALPAQMVRPPTGELTWMLDAGSASDLNISKWEDRTSFPATKM